MAKRDPAAARAALIAEAMNGDREVLGIIMDAVPLRLPRRTRRRLRDRTIRRIANMLLADDPQLSVHRVAHLVSLAGFRLSTRRALSGEPFADWSPTLRETVAAELRPALDMGCGWVQWRQMYDLITDQKFAAGTPLAAANGSDAPSADADREIDADAA